MAPLVDPVGAFVPHGHVTKAGAGSGPLAGVRVAVKDLFDWAGVPTGAGNPAWLTTHPAPDHDAAVLTTLLEAGVTLHGKTVTDELAYSIHGANVHYGTPANPAALGRVPGGSSSGSASAVAASLVEAALGTDTGGSIRVPAAYCGLYGLRTTHGLVDRSGLVPLAPSFDTVGWFARDVTTLAAVTEALLPAPSSASVSRLWRLPEAEALTDHETRQALEAVVQDSGLPAGELDGLLDPFGGLEGLRQVYVTIQSFEAWQVHGSWITTHRPPFGAAIAQRFLVASKVSEGEVAGARAILSRFRTELRAVLGSEGLLLMPATAGPAPLVGEDSRVVDEVRTRTMRLTSPAGLAGLPQLTVPVRKGDLPRGVGLVGPAGSDRALVAWASTLGGL